VAFTQTAPPAATAQQCVWQAFHLLNQFDLPRGAIRAHDHGNLALEYTNWTTAADLKNLRYYFHTYENRRVKMLDLKKIDWNAKDIKSISMQEPDAAQDVSDAAKAWSGQDPLKSGQRGQSHFCRAPCNAWSLPQKSGQSPKSPPVAPRPPLRPVDALQSPQPGKTLPALYCDSQQDVSSTAVPCAEAISG
jgi:hypothetical protein